MTDALLDTDRQRRIAARLADTLEPLIAAELNAVPGPVVVRTVAAPADKALLQAARKVADAVSALDCAKYVGGREVAARQALERAARSLRTQIQKREARNGK